MIIPVRCFTCGKVIGNLEKPFNDLKNAGMEIQNIYQELGIKKICCKRMLFTHVDVESQMAQYTELPEKVHRTENIDNQRIFRAR